MSYGRAYLGGKCSECGSKEDLEFDHVDPLTKLFALTDFPLCAWQKWHDELEKCQLLCSDCHNEKTCEDRAQYWERRVLRRQQDQQDPVPF